MGTWAASIFHSMQFSLNTPYVQSTRGLQRSSREETNTLHLPIFYAFVLMLPLDLRVLPFPSLKTLRWWLLQKTLHIPNHKYCLSPPNTSLKALISFSLVLFHLIPHTFIRYLSSANLQPSQTLSSARKTIRPCLPSGSSASSGETET